ncbi:hypothetical protein HPB50_027897 [Hyalomma asiaticum]|nr:hypothetical protein HPB50_027897 [Hyalomma asiaticum]
MPICISPRVSTTWRRSFFVVTCWPRCGAEGSDNRNADSQSSSFFGVRSDLLTRLQKVCVRFASVMASRGTYRPPKDLKTKVEILRKVENSILCKTEITKKYYITKSMLSTYIKNKESIIAGYEKQQIKPSRKRLQTLAHPQLEDALVMWIKQPLFAQGEVCLLKKKRLSDQPHWQRSARASGCWRFSQTVLQAGSLLAVAV